MLKLTTTVKRFTLSLMMLCAMLFSIEAMAQDGASGPKRGKNELWFDQGPEDYLSHSWESVRLGEKRSLSPEAFYHRVGRHDLAKAYESRSRSKFWLKVGGGLLVVGGGSLMVSGYVGALSSAVFSDKNDASNTVKYGVGAALLGIGTVSIISGIIYDPQPISLGQAKHLVREHESGQQTQPVATSRPKITWDLGLDFSEGQTGATFQMRF